MLVPLHLDERWSLDFVSDQLTDGRRFGILAIVDDCMRECRMLGVDASLPGRTTRPWQTSDNLQSLHTATVTRAALRQRRRPGARRFTREQAISAPKTNSKLDRTRG